MEENLNLDDFEIDMEKEEEALLGKGSFANVYRALHTKLRKKFAIKVIEVDLEKTDGKEGQNIKREIAVHKRIHHPYVIKFHSYEHWDNKVFLILEYAEKGNLFNFLKKLKSPMKDDEIWEMYRKICEGVLAIHENGIVHWDLKPENILINADNDPKICDFGWSTEIG